MPDAAGARGSASGCAGDHWRPGRVPSIIDAHFGRSQCRRRTMDACPPGATAAAAAATTTTTTIRKTTATSRILSVHRPTPCATTHCSLTALSRLPRSTVTPTTSLCRYYLPTLEEGPACPRRRSQFHPLHGRPVIPRKQVQAASKSCIIHHVRASHPG